MPYAVHDQIAAAIPPAFFTDALDDNADGTEDAGLWANVSSTVDLEINGALGQRYAVPFTQVPTPPVVAAAAFVIACYLVYHRRVADEQNPFTDRYKSTLAKLSRIGRGEEPLDPSIQRADNSASIVEEHSKTFSRHRHTL